jgi:tetratricopeptide (TPR) repeat protein
LLRALPLLGRNAAVETLHNALSDGLSGRGSAFFIEGESGVGKSRLLEELRRAAVARGVIVLEGRGEASDRSPYRVFRLPLLRLALRAGSEALDDFQFEVLTPLIPELPARLGRAATASAAADAESKRDALSAVVVSLLRQQREPLLLLLEDLQWSGSESFALLSELVSLSEHQPLIIVCGCRSEERAACPPLPAGMRSLSLERLTADEIAEACARLLDGPEAVSKELVALLARETEGNAFFLVEALRALAEEAGSLSAVKAASLPDRIFTGGIQTLIRRHLSAISERGRPLLRAAAVLGRTTDPAVLRALSPGTDVEAWIEECVAAAVLERIDAGRELGVRFRHDKLRETLLDELEPAERRALHARVATALEQTRADDRSQLAPLARHFQAAGDEEKELSFAAQAGEQALYSRAYTEAAEFLERAITLSERLSRRELLPQLYALRAELHAQRSEWAAAQREIATVFAAAGRPLWELRFGHGFFLFVQVLVHLFRSLLPASAGAADPRRAVRSRALVRAADVQLNIALSRGDNVLALGSSFLALNVGERGQNTSVRALFLVGLAAKVARLAGVTRRYIARANELLPLTSDRKDLSEALSYSGLYWIGEGKLGRAREQLLRSVEASTRIGYQQPLAWSLGQLSMCASLRGKFAEMLEQAEVCERETIAGEPTQVAARCTQTLALVRLGRLDEAKQRLATLATPSASESPLTLAIRAATAARVELAQGRLATALRAADEVHRILPWVSQVPPVWPDVLTAPIEVYLAAWQAARDARAGDARLASITKRRVRALESWSRLYPVARPIADYFSGRAEALLGNQERAAVLLERAHEGARARALGYYGVAAGDALAELRKPRQTSPM